MYQIDKNYWVQSEPLDSYTQSQHTLQNLKAMNHPANSGGLQ